LWFGTKDGLNRFDGYRFKTFHINANDESNLSRDQIAALFIDDKGTLWVGALKGLFRFDAQKEVLVPFVDSLKDIYDIGMDTYGRLWFTSGLTAHNYDFKTKKLTAFPPEKYFNATAFAEYDGSMWFATTDGLLKEMDLATGEVKEFNVFEHSPALESPWMEKIVPDKKGLLYIGTPGQGLKVFDTKTSTYKDLLTYNPDKTTIFVRDILQADENEFWIATESGIFILNTLTSQITNLRKKYLDPYSLSDNAIYSLHKDREGGIWAGTYFGGINYYAKQTSSFQKYYADYSPHSITGTVVREICEDKNGNLWIATEDAGLNKLNPSTGEIKRFVPTGNPHSISYSNIHGLLVVDNDLWIGTFEHGLDVMDIRTGKVKKRYVAGPDSNDLKSNFIVSLVRARDGTIYLGSSYSFYKYNAQHDNFTMLDVTPQGSFISCVVEDHRGVIWIGTHASGVFYYDPKTGEKGNFQNMLHDKNSITTNTINCIFEDSFRNLWFGTEGGGLCQLTRDRKKIIRHTARNGLPSNFVFKVLEDKLGKLWVTTSKGLVNMDIISGGKKIFTRANGLLNDQFNYNSGYKDSKGNLYFGSVRGMITFKPNIFSQSKFVPPVFITGFQVHGEELEIGKDSNILHQSILFTDEIILPHDRSSFSIDFAAISFTSPEMTEYSYFMNGLDKEWVYIKSNRKVYFTNLEPGVYNFRVKATSDGFYGQQEKNLTIRILPPFWATTWAYAAYILIAALLLYYIVAVYHNVQENKKQKEIYEAKINFFTNIAHEIKTPLTLIKGPVDNLSEMVREIPQIEDDVGMMERNTKRLVDLTTQILDFRQVEAKGFSLDFTEVNLNKILQDLFVTFEPLARKKRLSYAIDFPPSDVTIMADNEALNKIFSNLFSNAVKYAEKSVSVRLLKPAKDDSFVTVEVKNDGFLIPPEMKEKIFEPFFRMKESIKQKGTGIGLALARSLTELHNGKLYVKTPEDGMNVFVLALPYQANQKDRRNTIEVTEEVLKT
jgi:signal transduction histidine kinase/ligand-binding sensor domain-containing protein